MQSSSASVVHLIRHGELELMSSGVSNARRNAEWMLSHALGCRSADLYLDPGRVPDGSQVESYDTLLRRRCSREPLQHVLGVTEFMALPFYSSPAVFVPRPDTEVLVERVEPHLRPGTGVTVADLGCGSGVIAISLLKRVYGLTAIAVDVSADATTLTNRNAELNGVRERLQIVVSSAADFLHQSARRFGAIISNPPYIPAGDIESLPPEVRLHEPPESLNGGSDGLNFYREIIPLVRGALQPGGIIAFETGASQAQEVSHFLRTASLVDIEVHRDYSGLDRVVTARRE